MTAYCSSNARSSDCWFSTSFLQIHRRTPDAAADQTAEETAPWAFALASRTETIEHTIETADRPAHNSPNVVNKVLTKLNNLLNSSKNAFRVENPENMSRL
jgi:hypothetical protein